MLIVLVVVLSESLVEDVPGGTQVSGGLPLRNVYCHDYYTSAMPYGGASMML